MPHAVLRLYDTAPAETVDTLLAHEDEVRDLFTSIPGFRSWGLVRTDTGMFSITVCEDKAGTDESIRRAAEWLSANVPGSAAPTTVIEGETVRRFEAESVPA